MALIQITADLTRVAKALERIAEKLDQMFPEPEEEIIEPSTEKDLHVVSYKESTFEPDPDDLWKEYAPRRNY